MMALSNIKVCSTVVLLILAPGVLGVGMLESIPSQNDEILTACVNEEISLTCSHDNSLRSDTTQWRFGVPVNCSSTVDQSVNGAMPSQCPPFTINNVTRLPIIPLSSTATALASESISNSTIECRDGPGDLGRIIGTTTLCIVGRLPAPSNLTCENVSTGLNVSWEAVNDTSCAMSDVYYNVSVAEENDISIIETATVTTITQGLLPSTRYTISVRARTRIAFCDGETAIVTCETSESLPMLTTQSSSAPMTDSSRNTASFSPSPAPLSPGAIAGIAVVGIIVAVLVFVVIIVIVIVIKKNSEDGKQESDPGIHAPLAADADQQHLPVYAMVDKSKKIPGDQPTYQDPTSIQHETAPTGDVYAVTEKKQRKGPNEAELAQMYSVPDKSRSAGLTYASLDMPGDGGGSEVSKRPAPTEYSSVIN